MANDSFEVGLETFFLGARRCHHAFHRIVGLIGDAQNVICFVRNAWLNHITFHKNRFLDFQVAGSLEIVLHSEGTVESGN